ncbi:phosphotransferase [Glaciihabitans sp. UYNi722]|uniref:maltokinase N-terminal cap-like domain-containing protein n=1 Tax=Glaciihabitans sp. UYNi722 TaxID=3156344 RepID=UPI00339ABEA6
MNKIPEYLAEWMTQQRWYAGKGRAPQFELIGGFRLETSEPASITVHFVLDHAEHPLLYQVPLTERRAPLDGGERALVSTREDESGTVWIYDGPQDPAFATALLGLILYEGQVLAADGSGRVVAHGRRDLGEDGAVIRSSRVLGGEQSNTSIIYDIATADGLAASPIICKMFRALHDGENPDVVLTAVLGAAGSSVVPRAIGHVTGQWRDNGIVQGVATGHLAFAQEFLTGVEDAWRVALRAIAADEDFSERAQALGRTTAVMHRTLAAALPSRETTPADMAEVILSMRQRFELAAREVPSLAEHGDALEEVYRRAQASPWPPLQRVHGDFHLGQVLAVPGRGWVVLDFEGEPLRPMRERSQPDIPLRDIAGMLRSFDYVAGSFALSGGEHASGNWASDCRNAFLDGYIEESGRDLREHRAVLDAFEIDKALYEAVYEARNRPGWLSIPATAITRLVERASRVG